MPSLNLTIKALTLASSSTTQIVVRNTARQYLAIQNTGVGAASFGFTSSSPSGAGTGISLDPASAAGGQGGSWEFTTAIPTGPVYGYSAAGTTVIVVEG